MKIKVTAPNPWPAGAIFRPRAGQDFRVFQNWDLRVERTFAEPHITIDDMRKPIFEGASKVFTSLLGWPPALLFSFFLVRFLAMDGSEKVAVGRLTSLSLPW